MFESWSVVVANDGSRSDEELKRLYGEEAIVTRLGKYNLIHLDNPDPEEIERRIAEFDPNDLYEDDCPLCQMLREEGGEVVYDERIDHNRETTND